MRQEEEWDSRLTPDEAHNIKDWLRAQNLTQQQLTKRMGLRDKSYVNRILNPHPDQPTGGGLALAQLRRLCRAANDMPLWQVFAPREESAQPPPPPTISELSRQLATISRQLADLQQSAPLVPSGNPPGELVSAEQVPEAWLRENKAKYDPNQGKIRQRLSRRARDLDEQAKGS